MLVLDVGPHALCLSLHMVTMTDATQQCQAQVHAGMVVHQQVISNDVQAEWAVTLTQCFLFVSCITGRYLG